MKVWILDRIGYDARGGNAQVFSTLEKAKAAVDVEWVVDSGGWVEAGHDTHTGDIWEIYERTLDEPNWGTP